MADHKPEIPVGSAKAVASGSLGPATWANVLYFTLGDVSGHTPGDVIASVVRAVHDFYANCFMPDLSLTWQHEFTTVTYRDATDSLVRVRVADAQAGAVNIGTEEAQVAYLVNWATGDPRKGGKPRQYICGVPGNRVADAARILSTTQATINAALIAWLTSLLTVGTGRVVTMQLEEMSFRNGNTWRDAAHTYPIIGGTVNPVVATQRRRVNRVRPH